jgi:hypothetical protein
MLGYAKPPPNLREIAMPLATTLWYRTFRQKYQVQKLPLIQIVQT